MNLQQIARVCHEANRAIQENNGDYPVSPEWLSAPEWQQASAIDGVQKAIDGATSEQLHQSWCDFKTADGWVYGQFKDETAKTHPCLVPYAELPESQKVKDRVFNSIVQALTA